MIRVVKLPAYANMLSNNVLQQFASGGPVGYVGWVLCGGLKVLYVGRGRWQDKPHFPSGGPEKHVLALSVRRQAPPVRVRVPGST